MGTFSSDLTELEKFIAEAWSLTGQGSYGCQGSTSSVPVEGTSSKSDESDRQLADDELLKIYIENYRERLSAYKPRLSAVIDQPDFQPVSFLQVGLEKSKAVCRISRYCSIDILKEYFEFHRNRAKELTDKYPTFEKSRFFKPAEELRSTFSIPTSLFSEIFGKKIEQKNITYLDAIDLLEKHINELLKLNPFPLGTGFLVGGSHLLTNHHVIPTREVAEQCVAQFNYEGELGTKTLDYEFDPQLFFVSNSQLDYTLVQLQPDTSTRRSAGYQFGWLDLIESEDSIAPGLNEAQVEKLIKKLKSYGYENEKLAFYGLTGNKNKLCGDGVAIIQHPRGRKKEIVLKNNQAVKLSFNNLDYRADTDYGSSGSPVFNMNWELVALTKKVIPKIRTVSKDNSENNSFLIDWVASQGTRICRIVEDLKKESFTNSKLQSFIEDFVVTSEQLNYPPLSSALEFNGESSYVDLGAHESLDTTQKFTVETWVQRNPMSGNGTIINREGAYSLSSIYGNITVTLQNNDKKINFHTKESVLNDGLWHHIVFTWDLENIAIYADGEEKTGWLWSGDENFSGPVGKSEKNLYIGCTYENQNYFRGSIAEVRLWSVVRQLKDIKQTMYRRLNSDDKKGLIGYWRFEEGEDKVYYNLAQISVRAPSSIDFSKEIKIQDRFGLQLKDYGYIDCGNSESLDIKEAITIEAWVKNNDINKDGFIVSRGGSWGEDGYSLWRWSQKIRVELRNGKEITIVDTKEYVLNDDLWHHIAFTWEQKSTDVQIYVDGEIQELEFRYDTKNFQGPIGEPKCNLNIGRSEKNGYPLNASIAQVCLWKIARTQNQIKADMQGKLEGNEIGLIGYWRLDEEEGDKAMNLVSKNYSSVHGGEWLKPYSALCLLKENQGTYGVSVKKLKRLKASQYPTLPLTLPIGLKFSEQGDYIDCGSGESLNTPSAITVEAWVKHKFGNCVIVSRGGTLEQNSGVNKGYSLSWHEGKIRVALSFGNSEKDKTTIVYSKENAPDDCMWHHIAFTWDKSSKEIAIYIDGRRQDSVVDGKSNTIIFQGQNKTIGLFADSLENLETNLIIGQKEADTAYRNVVIAEVRLWNVARTQAQIKANMSQRLEHYRLNGKEEKLKGLVGYWRLDDGDKDTNQVRNVISENNHGTVHGAEWFPASPEKLSDT
ncbi:hypothetical protein NIES4073_25840 [Kalymmatonema gypsitolerans NIES-4073]|nr:hypothetical protein NIES4073_25840 [Scytonema sp. NIES-4073]